MNVVPWHSARARSAQKILLWSMMKKPHTHSIADEKISYTFFNSIRIQTVNLQYYMSFLMAALGDAWSVCSYYKL